MVSSGTPIFDTRPSNFELFSGESAFFTCVPIARNAFVIWVIQPVHDPGVTVFLNNNSNLTGADRVFQSPDRTRIFVTGVRKSLHKARIDCRVSHDNMQISAGDAFILVKRPPNFEPAPGIIQTVEFQNSMLLLHNIDGGFPEATADVLYDGNTLNTSQFSVSKLSISWTILIPGVLRSDSGLYTVRLINVYGAVSGNFTVEIIYPPEYSRDTAPQIDQLLIGSSFIFNCTESDAKPSIVMHTFRKNDNFFTAGISVLTISSVVRADTGNYSCTATNTAGSTTSYYYLLAVAPPTKPLSLSVHQVSAFSATLSWTAPSDDGGISNPPWTPPPGSPTLLEYSVVYANSSGSWTTEAMTTQSTLGHLQHSTNYNVTVSAQNAYGKSAVALGRHFRSRDTVPILQEVVVVPFSLTSIRVDVTLLTNGGRDVTLLTIRFADIIQEDNTTFSGSFASLHFTGLNLTHGNSYSLSASASNSIGVSAPASRVAYIPNRLMIPEPLSELPLSEITTYCAGFMINVQNPSVDIVDFALQVTANGVPSTSSQYTVLRNGLKVQLSGLQAGTRYLFDVTFGNAFGMRQQQISLVSLLGKPSKPPVPQVSVSNTNVTVNVTTFYPGTQGLRDNSFLYFILRFTDLAMVVQESRITVLSLHLMPDVPVSATYNTELNVGSYTLTVTAVNEHGSVRSDSTSHFFASDIIFKPAPSNSSVLKQGMASFTCRPESNSSENVFVIWIIQPVSAPGITVRKDNMSTLVGSTAVYMSPDRTQIFISGVQSSLDGASVECRGASVNQLSAGLVYIHLQYPPNITALPTELSPSSHSPCCSAVKLNLAEPGGVSSVGVSLSTGGGPFEVVDSGDVSLGGDVLYISGLQAGAVYVAIISISNLDATITTNVTLQPLIGVPHDPALPLVFINGSEVRVMLSTDWPGTSTMFNRSQFMFQLSFLAVHEVAPNVAIQNIYVNVTNYSAPVNATYQLGILHHGSYKVKVSAINEHGSSGEIESEQFSVLSRTDRPTNSSNHVQILVPAVAGVAGVALLLLLIFLGILIFCVAYRRYCMVKLNVSHAGSKEDYIYDEVEMRPVAVNDVLCVQMQGNPSYKPLRSGSGITPGHISLPDTQPSQQEDSIDEGYIVTDSGQNDQPSLPAIGEHIVLNDNPSY